MVDLSKISDERIIEIAKEVLNEWKEDEISWNAKLYFETNGKQGRLPGEEKKTIRYRYPSNNDIEGFSNAVRYCSAQLDKMYKPTIPTLFGMNRELQYNVFSFVDSRFPTQVLNMNDLSWEDKNFPTGTQHGYLSVAPIAVYVDCYKKNVAYPTTLDGVYETIKWVRQTFKEKFPQFSVLVTENGEKYLPKDLIKDCRRPLVDKTRHKDPRPYERQNVYVILNGISAVADIVYEDNGIKVSEDDDCIYVSADNYNDTGKKKTFTFDKKTKEWRKRGKGMGIPVFKDRGAAVAIAKCISYETGKPIPKILSLHYNG